MVAMRRPDTGQIVQVPASMIHRARAQKVAQAQVEEPEQLQFDPAEVATAVTFIETAFRNGTKPEILAASARNLIPRAILTYVKSRGVDSFLNNVAQLDDNSPLATVAGRNYIRSMAKFLLEGIVDDEPAVPEPEPEIIPEPEPDILDDLDISSPVEG